MEDKPNVLILGGVGFIGRNLVKYIVDNDLAKYVRAVDKVLPPTAFLGKIHQEAFDNPIVEFKQGNLTSPASIEKIFTIDGGEKFDIVFNLAAETKYSQTDEIYKEKVQELSVKCATEAVKQGVKKFVEVSTGQVYESKKKSSNESGKVKPWTLVAKYKFAAEEDLKKMDGLPLVIARPAIVYGPGDVQGLAPRLICGAVYKHLGEKMKFLWGSDLRINTVHVRDCCRALWHLATKCPVGETYNIVDESDMSQGKLNKIIENIFGIKTGFLGGMLSSVAKLNMKAVTEEVNDKHLKPWSELCKSKGIENTPLTPYLDPELLYNNSTALEGKKLAGTEFKLEHPEVTEDLLRESLSYFVEQGLFPEV